MSLSEQCCDRAVITNLRPNHTIIQAALQAALQPITRRLDTIDIRMKNSSSIQDGDVIEPTVNQNAPPHNFPTTIGALKAINLQQAKAILAYYGIDENRTLSFKKKRIARCYGLQQFHR
jgi:hypothetical protein